MEIIFHSHFKKGYKKLSKKHQESVDETIETFMEDPLDESLRNHKLQGKYLAYRSLDVTGDLRILYREVSKDVCIFYLLGTHSELYR